MLQSILDPVRHGVAVVLGMAMLAGCAPASISGWAAYSEPEAVPPGSMLRVSLQESARADLPGVSVAETVVSVEGQPPFEFELLWPDGTIRPDRSYALVGEIRGVAMTRFTTREPLPVRPGADDDNVQLLLTAVPMTGAPPPVRGTGWLLDDVGGRPVTVSDLRRQPYLLFDANSTSFGGSSGCSRLQGSYVLDEQQLVLTLDDMPRRYVCTGGWGAEGEVFAALEKVRGWRHEGMSLELLDAQGLPVMRLMPWR